jgi:hypothetical protein
MRSKHNCVQLSLLSFEKENKLVRDLLDANLIRATLECRDIARLACLYRGTFGQCAYSQK